MQRKRSAAEIPDFRAIALAAASGAETKERAANAIKDAIRTTVKKQVAKMRTGAGKEQMNTCLMLALMASIKRPA